MHLLLLLLHQHLGHEIGNQIRRDLSGELGCAELSSIRMKLVTALSTQQRSWLVELVARSAQQVVAVGPFRCLFRVAVVDLLLLLA